MVETAPCVGEEADIVTACGAFSGGHEDGTKFMQFRILIRVSTRKPTLWTPCRALYMRLLTWQEIAYDLC